MTQAPETTDVVQIVTQYFQNLFGGDKNAALDLSSVDLGADFGGLDVTQIANQCAADSPLGHDAKQALSGYAGGSPGYPPPPPPAYTKHAIEQSVSQAVQVVYQDNDVFNYVDNSRDTEIDNSTNIDGPVFGDVDVNNENNVASGDGSQVIDGDNFGTAQANSGDGAVQAGDDAKGVNTGLNTGVIAGGDIEDTVIGDDNNVDNVDGDVGQGAVLDNNSGFAGGINVSTGGNTGGDASGTGGSGSGGFAGDGGDGGGGGGGLLGGGGGGAGGAGGSADGTGGSGFGGVGGAASGGNVNIDLGGFGSGDRTNVENSNLNESQVNSGGDNEQSEVRADVMPLDYEESTPDPAVTLPPPPETTAVDVMPGAGPDTEIPA